MTVTQIEKMTSSRIGVYVDGEFAFVLYKGELHKYGIQVSKEIPEKIYREIMDELLPKRAKLRCMNLLKSRDYTKKQLADKLRKSNYTEEVIEEALNYVESFHYIDDVRYAKDYLIWHGTQMSKKNIAQKLLQKGISQADFDMAYMQWQQDGNEQNEDAQIQALLSKRHFHKEDADRKELQKTYAFLARKGFESEKIYRALFR